jgi:gas vesicle protein
MKKSELKQFIREEIISTLSEAEQGVIHTKDQRKAEELAKKGLNVSIDEGNNTKITAPLVQFLDLQRFNSSELKDFEYISTKIHDYAENIDIEFSDNEALDLAKQYIAVKNKINERKKKSEDEDEDVEVKDDWNKVDKEDSFVEKEPSAKDLKKGDKVTKMAAKLAMVTKEMKSVVSQWKKAEGSEKDRLLNRLKELTKVKKELDAFITPTIGTDED